LKSDMRKRAHEEMLNAPDPLIAFLKTWEGSLALLWTVQGEGKVLAASLNIEKR